MNTVQGTTSYRSGIEMGRGGLPLRHGFLGKRLFSSPQKVFAILTSTDGGLVVPRKKLLLEEASFDYIGRCSDASGDLVKLLGTRQ
jgi:hypothetical protein